MPLLFSLRADHAGRGRRRRCRSCSRSEPTTLDVVDADDAAPVLAQSRPRGTWSTPTLPLLFSLRADHAGRGRRDDAASRPHVGRQLLCTQRGSSADSKDWSCRSSSPPNASGPTLGASYCEPPPRRTAPSTAGTKRFLTLRSRRGSAFTSGRCTRGRTINEFLSGPQRCVRADSPLIQSDCSKTFII